MKKSLLYIGGSIMAAAVSATGAFAQEADAVGGSDFGEILVVARKTEESSQKVPIAITALGGEALQQRTIQSVRDIQFNVPGLVNYPEAQGGAPDFAIRGTKQQGLTGSQGGVAVYLGYVPLSSTFAIKNSNYDMQSVEVLKGPQGTLFGKNTTGGAVIFRPNEPTDKFEGMIQGSYGRWNRKDLTGMVNFPIGEGIALRAAGRIVNSDGRIKNVQDPTDPDVIEAKARYGDNFFTKDLWAEDNQSARVSLKMEPSDTLKNVTMFDWYHQTKDQTDNQAGLLTTVTPACGAFYGSWNIGTTGNPALDYLPAAFGGAATLAADDTGCQADFERQQEQGTKKTTRLWPTYVSGTWWGISNVTELELGGVTLRNIFGYRDDKLRNSEDDDGNDAPMLQGWNALDTKAWSDEVNVIGKAFDDRLDYTLGVFWSDQDTRQRLSYSIYDDWHDRDPLFWLASAPWYTVSPRWTDVTFSSKSLAGFGQVNYKIDDQLTLTVGARYTKTKLKYQGGEWVGLNPDTITDPANYDQSIRSYQGQPVPLDDLFCTTGAALSASDVFDATTCTVTRKKKYNSFIFNGGLQYQVDPRTMIYVTVSKGFQAGGFNNGIPVEQYQTFAPETVMNFEGGLKKDWHLFGRPIRTNVALFYAKYKNQQRNLNGSFTQDDIDNYGLEQRFFGSTFTGTFNAADSTTWGGELEISYNLTDNLSLSGFYTYINAKYDSFTAPAIGDNASDVDLRGLKLANTPTHTASGTVTYSLPVNADDGNLRFTLTGYYRSGFNTSDLYFGGETDIKGYALFNGRIDLIKTLPFDIGVWGNNLFDKKYAIYTNQTLGNFGLARTDFGEPRSYGVEATFRW